MAHELLTWLKSNSRRGDSTACRLSIRRRFCCPLAGWERARASPRSLIRRSRHPPCGLFHGRNLGLCAGTGIAAHHLSIRISALSRGRGFRGEGEPFSRVKAGQRRFENAIANELSFTQAGAERATFALTV